MRSEKPEPESTKFPPDIGTDSGSRLRAPLIVVSGPSGVGKTTVVEELLKRRTLALRRAVTATTRSPRENETPGISYHYWTPEGFDRAIEDGRMLEWATVFGTDRYGTPRSEVDTYRANGIGVVLVIDVQGAARVRALCPDCFVDLHPAAEFHGTGGTVKGSRRRLGGADSAAARNSTTGINSRR